MRRRSLVAMMAIAISAVTSAAPADVIGTGPLFHIVGDIDKSVAFYRGLLGIQTENVRPRSYNPISLARDPRNNFFVEPMEPAGTAAASR